MNNESQFEMESTTDPMESGMRPLTESEKEAINGLVEKARLSGIKPDISGKAKVKIKSIVPGSKPESYVETKLRIAREKKVKDKEDNEVKKEKDLQDFLRNELDPSRPIKNATDYINDSTELTSRVVALLNNPGIQESVSIVDELVKEGNEEAKELSKALFIRTKAFHNDMTQSGILCKDLSNTIKELEPMIEKNKTADLNGEILELAVKLDAVATTAKWTLADTYAVTAQSLVEALEGAVELRKTVQQATDVDAITDVKPKTQKDEK